jgi:hypothetical protein
MARSPVSILVGTAALVLAVVGTPRRLEGQSSGVLQATVRVVDYSNSLAALKTAQSTWAQAVRLQEKAVVRTAASARPEVIAVAEPMVVTINYLR